MADAPGVELNLNLTPEEKRVFGHLFAQADTDQLGVVTGEVAVKFFERTKLSSSVLGQIWQIADKENRGLLTSPGFCMVLRLIGHYQAGRDPTPELAFRPGPLPKFEGLNLPSGPLPPPGLPPTLQPQISGGGIRVPPLLPEKAAEYAALFDKSGAQNGVLPGENAKQIFEKARLPNETLGRIWNLADTEQRGALGVTEFIIAMHLLASFKSGQMKALPANLPAGLYEAASRRGPPPSRLGAPPPAAIPRQFSGAGSQRAQSPLGRSAFGPPPQPMVNDWVITPHEKASYDNLFSKVDTAGRGYLTGEQAVVFFSDSGLPEDTLASIWDLADINSEGQLNRDEFAVAMYLIRQQRKPGIPLPVALPPNLVPPSMRNQTRAPAQPTAPTFDNAAYAQTPKSASEDLFGLDAFSTPPPPVQTQQTTGGSGSFVKPFEADPFGSKAGSPTASGFQTSPRATTFKPFVPTSSFGQGLTAHSTGASANSSMSQSRMPQPPQPSAVDDLLGDNDPEESKKLTSETTELANMSNQVGALRNQMQEVQNKKITTEKDLQGSTTQKRDLELRLSQFRTQYEQEAKLVKDLEDRLTVSRNETRKLQQDLAMIEGTYQDLQAQHRQVATALEADQRENASLKERIRQLNAEIGQMRPQLDKMRSDARQQKGMVAINKKQLATNEGEREKIKGEMNDLSRTPTGQDVPSAVASPATSTASHSTNPFFRKSPQPTTDNTMSPSGFAPREGSFSQGPKDFDSVFGPSFSPGQPLAPPSTSFRAEGHGPAFGAQSGPSVRSSEGPDVPTPSTSPPLSTKHDSPRPGEPPAPPESRQFGSSFLPLREGATRTESFSSSVKVSAPTSRYGAGGSEAPTISAGSPAATPMQEGRAAERAEPAAFGSALFDRNNTASPAASATSEGARSRQGERKDTFQGFGPSEKDIPGAFPSDASINEKGEDGDKNNSRSDPFAPRGQPSAKDDFEAAFAGFGSSRPVQEKQHTGSSLNGTNDTVAANKFNREFPPIEDIGQDDDSDSTGEQGFDDNFTAPSPPQGQDAAGQVAGQTATRPGTANIGAEGAGEDFFRQRPSISHNDTGASLPSPNAQKSPPSYDQTVSSPSRSGTKDSNQFPPEFGGLLPSRQDPTSPSQGSLSPGKTFSVPASGGQGQALFGKNASPPAADTPSTVPSDAYQSAVSYPSGADKGPPQQPQTSKASFNDDFDAGFDDLAEAKEVDEKGDDEFMNSNHRGDGFDDFNPVFDSPAASKSNTMASQQTPTGRSGHGGEDSFSDFEHLTQSFAPGKSPQQPTASSSQDWDAIFSNLDSQQTEKPQGEASKSPFPSHADETENDDGPSKQPPLPMPPLGRAISSGTEHDDPILKKLTGMGYSRSDALDALEKFDYDINKAVDHLSSSQ